MSRVFAIFISSVFASVFVGLNSEVLARNFQIDSNSSASPEWLACGGGGGGGGSGAKKRAARKAMMQELKKMQEEQNEDDD